METQKNLTLTNPKKHITGNLQQQKKSKTKN